MSSERPALKSAGIIVIGDEILKGYTRDTNSHFLCQELLKLGVRVERISTIPDALDVIGAEVASFSGRFDHVFTSGGVGPTHDDITYEGVARGFGDVCTLNPDLERLVRAYFRLPEGATLGSSPQLKLAAIPSTATLLWGVDASGRRSLYPSVRVGNVVVFPGIPSLLRRAFAMIKEEFRHSGAQLHQRRLYLDSDEFAIAETLSQTQARLASRGLAVGSYPKLDHSYYRVKVTLDSVEEAAADEAFQELRQAFSGSVVHYDESPFDGAVDKFERFQAAADEETRERISEAYGVIDPILQKSTDLSNICISFNGGKDCTALLHLLWLRVKALKGDDWDGQLKALYIRPKAPFPEMEAFVKESVERYNLELIQVNGPIKAALVGLKASHPALDTIFMGTRIHDPNGRDQGLLAPTDGGWPAFLRANPVHHWGYAAVWALIRGLWLPYAPLYDKGYTSIGGRDNTAPNPALAWTDGFGLARFRAAHALADAGLERAGRSA